MKSTKNINNKFRTKVRKSFNPFRLISDDEFVSNLNALIAYYQILKGRDRGRFVSSYSHRDDNIYNYASYPDFDKLIDDKVVEDDFEAVEDVLEESLV